MSNWKTHLIGGLVATIVVTFLMLKLGISFSILYIPVYIFYSLFPDIDSPASNVRWFVFIVLLLGLIVYINVNKFLAISIIIALILILINDKLAKKKNWHRTWIHGVPAAVLFSLPMLLLGVGVFIIAFINYITHLGLDAISTAYKKKKVEVKKNGIVS